MIIYVIMMNYIIMITYMIINHVIIIMINSSIHVSYKNLIMESNTISDIRLVCDIWTNA